MNRSNITRPDDMMPGSQALTSQMRMARAVEGNWSDAWATLGLVDREPRSLVDDTAWMLRVVTPGLPDTLLNMVMRYRARRTVIAADVEQVIAPYRRHGLPFQWWLMRESAPAGLREQLYSVGMRSWGGATMMYLDLASWDADYPASPPGVSYSRITTAAERDDALRIISHVFAVPAFPMSRWTSDNQAFTLYLAHWGNQPVATVATLPVGETVGVYHVATLPEARRRGIAGNLLLLALRESQENGLANAILTATPDGQHLYAQLGFRACGLLEQWTAGPRLTDELLRHAGHANHNTAHRRQDANE
jgi:GNAT superfamily N-acetyltransferase